MQNVNEIWVLYEIKEVCKMDKYVCPICGGQLYVNYEHLYEIQQDVDTRTGKLKKKLKREYKGDCATLLHINCRNCNYSYNEECDDIQMDNLLIQCKNDKNFKVNIYDNLFWDK